MTYIENVAEFEARLEQGIGEVYGDRLFNLRPNLRLRLEGVCAVASIAVQTTLNRWGIDSELIHSKPRLPFDVEADHIFVLVNGETIIDPSYSQFVHYAGVIPYDVQRGASADIYPLRKLEEFHVHHASRIALCLAEISIGVLDMDIAPFDKYDKRLFTNPELHGMPEGEIARHFGSIWHPNNFHTFEPTVATLAAGRRVGEIAAWRSVEPIA